MARESLESLFVLLHFHIREASSRPGDANAGLSRHKVVDPTLFQRLLQVASFGQT